LPSTTDTAIRLLLSPAPGTRPACSLVHVRLHRVTYGFSAGSRVVQHSGEGHLRFPSELVLWTAFWRGTGRWDQLNEGVALLT
jgi:hypothetical protein